MPSIHFSSSSTFCCWPVCVLHMVAPSMRQELHYLQESHKINCRIILVAFLQVVQLLPQACCLPLPELLVKQEVLSVSELQNISVEK